MTAIHYIVVHPGIGKPAESPSRDLQDHILVSMLKSTLTTYIHVVSQDFQCLGGLPPCMFLVVDRSRFEGEMNDVALRGIR